MRWWRRLVFWLNRRRMADELREEMETHRALREDALSKDDAGDAHARSRRALGNVTLAAEDSREVWGWLFLLRLQQDVHYALRLMRRTPIVTFTAVVSIALGIGANGAIFSAFDALLLRPLPVTKPDQLVMLTWHMTAPVDAVFRTWNHESFLQFRGHIDSASSVIAIADVDASNIDIAPAGSDPASAHVELVSGDYFSTLGVTPALGRWFTTADDVVPGGHPVAVISEAYRRRRGLPLDGVVGSTLKLRGTTYAILGLASKEFTGDWIGHPTDIWIPRMMQAQVMVDRPGLLSGGGSTWLRILARVRDGASARTVQSEANAILGAQGDVVVESAARGYSREGQQLRPAIAIVMAVVGIVLLIACANVAVLLLARAEARRNEMTLRIALGAGRWRLMRQAFTESAVLVVTAGGLAVVVAVLGATLLDRLLASGATTLALDLRLDARVIAFMSIAALGTAIVFGLVPASRLWRRDSDLSRPGRFRLGRAFVTLQVAASLVLVAGAGLFVRTLTNLETQDLGLERSHTWLVHTSPDQIGLRGDAIASLMDRLPNELADIPGVSASAASSFATLDGVGSGARCTVSGYVYRPDEDVFVRTNNVSPGYFATMGMPLASGRDVGPEDRRGSARVAVINETMARYYWGTVDAVGRRFGLGRDTGAEIEVVGVVHDAHTEHLREPVERTVFLPYQQDASHLQSLALAVRTASDSMAIVPLIRDRLRQAMPTLPVTTIGTVDDNVRRLLLAERTAALLSTLFGGIAGLLTALGLYGVMAYTTSRRTREIAIRMALGADRPRALWLVVRGNLALVVVGTILGMAAAWISFQGLASMLFGVTATDELTMAIAATLMFAVGALASYVPARRAARTNPALILRAD